MIRNEGFLKRFCLFRSELIRRSAIQGTGRDRYNWSHPAQPPWLGLKLTPPMRDFVIAVLFVAMVLTPAVVAARSGKDLHSGK